MRNTLPFHFPWPGANTIPNRDRTSAVSSSPSMPSGARIAVTQTARSRSSPTRSSPSALDRLLHRARVPPVAREHVLDTFLAEQADRLAQTEVQRHGRRVRVLRLLAVVGVAHRRPVEVEARALRPLVRLPRRVAHAHERDARRHHQALLHPADGDVDAPLVDQERRRAQARDRVDDEQRGMVLHDGPDSFDVVDDSGRGLGVLDQHALDVGLERQLRRPRP